MMLTDNRNYLRIHNRSVLDNLQKQDERAVLVEESRKNIPTLKMNVNSKWQYLHSKYDPESEAERLIERMEGLEQYKHILFFGVGLGYHIKALLNRFPDMSYSIFEPNMNVLNAFLSYQKLYKKPFNQLKHILLSTEEEEIKIEMTKLYHSVGDKIFVFQLPVYDKIYHSALNIGLKCLKELLNDKRSSMITNAAFQKRWILNSVKNFPYLLQTPNILHDIERDAFRGKSAIIVAAGPSLSEEFEYLRGIKEKKLAYIFSVGSAVNALIENGIYPDAACTYDPTEKNQLVIQKVKNQQISSIPLIFGSSVGYETLESYPSPMLHMITSQDTIAPHLLNINQNIDIVLDAPSIAVVTFQLLSILGCNKIILAGQNLAYLNNERYSKGIKYEHISNILTEKELQEAILIKDVDGNDVYTTDGFNRMRSQLEWYIHSSPNISVFNTTKGGAHIEGTEFKVLSEVINDELDVNNQIKEDWYQFKNTYDVSYSQKQLVAMEAHRVECVTNIKKVEVELNKIASLTQKHQLHQLEKQFVKFDKRFSFMKMNLFYQGFIEPMIRVQNQRLSEESQALRYEKDLLKKAQRIIELFGQFIKDVDAHYDFISPHFTELREKVCRKM